MTLPGLPYIAGGSFLIGSLGGGYLVHKLWWGKAAADNLKRAEASLTLSQEQLDKSRVLAENSAERAEREAMARQEAETRLSHAYADNAALAASRASTTTKIIEKGLEIGETLKNDYPCVYEPWPDRLRVFAFRDGDTPDLSGSASGYYPASE